MARRQTMTADMAVAILDALGCSDDPVTVLNKSANFRDGEETEMSRLNEFQFIRGALAMTQDVPARRIRVRYWTGRGEAEGTLHDVLLNRLKDYGLGATR